MGADSGSPFVFFKMKVYFSSVTKDPKEHWTELVRREKMGEINIPGVTFYDHIEFTEFVDKVSITAELNINDPDSAFRKVLGWPEKPIRHKKLNRKSFKKALMAWGMPRNAAEKTCNYVANTPFWGCGYDYYAERHYNYIWR